MTEIVNLRLARKAKKRAVEQVNAAANRAKFGQTKGSKAVQQREAQQAQNLLDGARRDRD